MNNEHALNYIKNTFAYLFNFKFRLFYFSIYRFIVYFMRLLRYQIFTTKKCTLCSNKMHVYFLRSEYTTGVGLDKTKLHDWFVCQNENCEYKLKINY